MHDLLHCSNSQRTGSYEVSVFLVRVSLKKQGVYERPVAVSLKDSEDGSKGVKVIALTNGRSRAISSRCSLAVSIEGSCWTISQVCNQKS